MQIRKRPIFLLFSLTAAALLATGFAGARENVGQESTPNLGLVAQPQVRLVRLGDVDDLPAILNNVGLADRKRQSSRQFTRKINKIRDLFVFNSFPIITNFDNVELADQIYWIFPDEDFDIVHYLVITVPTDLKIKETVDLENISKESFVSIFEFLEPGVYFLGSAYAALGDEFLVQIDTKFTLINGGKGSWRNNIGFTVQF